MKDFLIDFSFRLLILAIVSIIFYLIFHVVFGLDTSYIISFKEYLFIGVPITFVWSLGSEFMWRD